MGEKTTGPRRGLNIIIQQIDIASKCLLDIYIYTHRQMLLSVLITESLFPVNCREPWLLRLLRVSYRERGIVLSPTQDIFMVPLQTSWIMVVMNAERAQKPECREKGYLMSFSGQNTALQLYSTFTVAVGLC